eukprot:111077_1
MNGMNVDNILKNYNILLTGASGFVGMMILQKLLRVRNAQSSQIFCALRVSAKYTSVTQRLKKEILTNEIMELSQNEIDELTNNERLVALQSDLTHDLLGFTEAILKKLKNSSLQNNKKGIVIIHSAADVRFNTELNQLINSNVNGTYQCIQVARKINAKSFIYISTLAVNSREKMDAVIEERIYENKINMTELFDAWLNCDFSETEIKHIKSMGNRTWPNNYAFTKNMCENVVNHYCNLYNLSSSIIRMGIVSPTHKGNNKGWFIGKGGFVFFMIGIVTGKLMYLHGNGSGRPNIIPVDYCADAVLVITSKTIIDNDHTHSKVFQCSVINHDPEWTVAEGVNYTMSKFSHHYNHALRENVIKTPPQYIENTTIFFLIELFLYDLPLYLFSAVLFILSPFTKLFWMQLFYYLIGKKYDLNLVEQKTNVINSKLSIKEQIISLQMILLTSYNKSFIASLSKKLKFYKHARQKMIWFNNNYAQFVNARWCFVHDNVTDLIGLLDIQSKQKYDLNIKNININLSVFEATETNYIKYLNYKQKKKADKIKNENKIRMQLMQLNSLRNQASDLLCVKIQ